ncbi:class I SAM-dependent methyltransferase [Thiomicrorhabdus heinhorstiae]|uniref:SAM-dependent methyltransferase n=1 Tax=Thiomicrorhabdus heinhorstiae TaxID=2748010 RepID=A0ABS0C0G3_9GAMM|nr:SAM-dependent methyltransferase [Thiomicrorhabdus heinhorstiae]MBF6057827.1 SAM-dependent methyltransferase [Thiomicrorhabdus heinhorstiae]
MANHKSLPQPSEDAQAHSAQLQRLIAKQIKRHGPIAFSKYMQMALYAPGLGYYASGLPKIGPQGDFITAPEVSPIFSRCLARQSAQILAELEHPNILEFGAGSGVMAKDILLELSAIGQNLERYYILELSADLRQRQQETLKAHLPKESMQKVVWLESLPSTAISAVVLANEVLDAMPFERLRIEPDRALQGFVDYNEQNSEFIWDYQTITHGSLQKFANQLIKHIGKVSDLGYETEINLNLSPWIKSLTSVIAQGALLLVDYGYTRQEYYQAARVMGTLRCHYQHRAHQNPFFYPGLQDITAHVDFTAVAEAAYDNGFKVAGFTTQAHFLMGSGLLEMSVDPEMDLGQQIRTAQQIKTLTLPDEMGETFKVIALTKGIEKSLIGFSVRDLRHQL